MRLDTNVPGDFYVDASCIDCATCRWMAPEVFDRAGGSSRVHSQPGSPEHTDGALAALVACPTASIGTVDRHPVGAVSKSFPRPIEPDSSVFHCGFHSEDSFGAAAWLLRRPEGNVLIDSPRFARPLVKRLEELGGVALMFLTHRDDVADHARFAEHFGCARVLHPDDVGPSTRMVEQQPREEVELLPGVRFLPTPGHTRGSACLLVDDTWLFTGDTLCWNRDARRLHAFRGACWHDWGELRSSVATLRERPFRWVLPGHGAPVKLDAGTSAARIDGLVDWMGQVA